jgi:hypothetical protein
MTDYMTDSAGESEQPAAPEAAESTSKTALIPIDFFQGKELNPGDTCEVQIEKVEDDQVQVKYLSEEAEDESEESESEPMEAMPAEEGGGAGQDMMM